MKPANLGGYRLGEVNSRRESRPPERHSEHMAPAQGARPSTKNGRVPGLFRFDQQTERLSAWAMMAEEEELSSNILFLIFQRLIITHHHLNYREDPPNSRGAAGAGVYVA